MPDRPSASQRPVEPTANAPVVGVQGDGRGRAARGKRYDAILSRFNALRVLRADEGTQGVVLEELAELGAPEHDIAEELLAPWPLAEPGRFEEAHQSLMRGLEVLERNGGRKVAISRIGPLDPLAGAIVSSAVGWITRRHRSSLLRIVRLRYGSREASSVPGSREHHMLRRARMQAAVLDEAFGGARGGVPGVALVAGGGAASAALAVLRTTLGSVFDSKLATILLLLAFGIIAFGLSWAFLYAAGVARRRIRLSTDLSVSALWQALGACGAPPKDQSYIFALLAIILLLFAWIVVPVVVVLLAG